MQIVTPADEDWPGQLDDLDDHAPLCLWVRGDPSILGRLQPSVALVGARAATSYGDHVALELSADLAGGGIPVVSGGAYGIDGAAHRAAMAVGGVTVALLAGGADRAYPAGHTQLIGRMAEVGAVVSEVPCGSAPTKWRFLQRNRLIAALSYGDRRRRGGLAQRLAQHGGSRRRALARTRRRSRPDHERRIRRHPPTAPGVRRTVHHERR